MKKNLALLFATFAWFAVIMQFVLMIENRTAPVSETIIRFFSFFTILTNTLVACYFTGIAFFKNQENKSISKPGVLTAVTIYITMVGAVYQFALRHIWSPQGMQMIVDELLHSVIPILVIVFWYLYEVTKPVQYAQVLNWALYPLVYLLFILVRGSFSNFYPYPFINVIEIGLTKALTNAGILVVVFMIISGVFLFIGKSVLKR